MSKMWIKIKKFIANPTYFLKIIYFRQIYSRIFKSKNSNFYRRIQSWNFGSAEIVDLADIDFNETKLIKILYPLKSTPDLSLDLYEIFVLNLFASQKNVKKILEIGTYDGRSAMNLSANSQENSILYTVDLPENDYETGLREVMSPFNNDTRNLTKIGHLIEEEKNRKVQIIRKDSFELNFKESIGNVDLVFIDGCHKFDYVKKDSINSFEILNPNGFLIWHDYGYVGDVSKFVDQWAKQNDRTVKRIAGTRIAYLVK
jgi:predicted O-methyltransferase YrrM